MKQKTKQWFINKIRNSIAHQNIDGVSVKGEWTGVCLSNIYSSRKDFEINFSVEELRNFALKLSTIYLEEKEASWKSPSSPSNAILLNDSSRTDVNIRATQPKPTKAG